MLPKSPKSPESQEPARVRELLERMGETDVMGWSEALEVILEARPYVVAYLESLDA